ncbi:hypothetical protein GGI35DRAFT_258245 [Trichoderma velutinum]
MWGVFLVAVIWKHQLAIHASRGSPCEIRIGSNLNNTKRARVVSGRATSLPQNVSPHLHTPDATSQTACEYHHAYYSQDFQETQVQRRVRHRLSGPRVAAVPFRHVGVALVSSQSAELSWMITTQ